VLAVQDGAIARLELQVHPATGRGMPEGSASG
jgi:hypothetical protein